MRSAYTTAPRPVRSLSCSSSQPAQTGAYGPADVIAGYAIGVDLTRRDAQGVAKQKGLPWTMAKGFDGAAQVSHFIPFESAPPFEELAFSLWVNGELMQNGNSRDMHYNIEEQISYLSQNITLQPGDVMRLGIDGLGVQTQRVVQA